MADNGKSNIELLSQTVQVLSVVVGVVISVLSYTSAQKNDAIARKAEADARQQASRQYYDQRRDELRKQSLEALQPYRALRQKRYAETLEAAAVLATPEGHTPDEVKRARTRFKDLYWVELSLVEGKGVETAMVQMGQAIDPSLTQPTPRQIAAYHLSHALRDSLMKTWGINETVEPESP